MIQRVAYNITQKIFDNQYEISDFEVHQYGVEVIISTIINVIIILFIGLITDTLIESILYFILFGLIRKFCGGYHCQTYFKCISLHVLIYILFVALKDVIDFYNPIFIFLCILSIIMLSPINMRNNDYKTCQRYKLISIVLMFIYLGIYYIIELSIILYVIYVVTLLMFHCIIEK